LLFCDEAPLAQELAKAFFLGVGESEQQVAGVGVESFNFACQAGHGLAQDARNSVAAMLPGDKIVCRMLCESIKNYDTARGAQWSSEREKGELFIVS
jgi:hypothetical protein